jgi:hypothetical protein
MEWESHRAETRRHHLRARFLGRLVFGFLFCFVFVIGFAFCFVFGFPNKDGGTGCSAAPIHFTQFSGEPLNVLVSTLPLTPGTLPLSLYCHSV